MWATWAAWRSYVPSIGLDGADEHAVAGAGYEIADVAAACEREHGFPKRGHGHEQELVEGGFLVDDGIAAG